MLTHTIQPRTLVSPRTFISLVVSAYLPPNSPVTDSNGWVTVQIPLSNEQDSNIPESIRARIVADSPKNTIFASYASVERVVSLSPPGRAGNGKKNNNPTTNNKDNSDASALDIIRTQSRSRRKIEWTLATTSDAGGSVPQFVQRSWILGGIPKAVVKDVGLFIGWVAHNRQ